MHKSCGIFHDKRMKKILTKFCTEINIKFEAKSSIRLFLDINYLYRIETNRILNSKYNNL